MKINEVKKVDRKSVPVTVRTTKTYSEFMKTQKLSPTKIFNKAVEELMKEKK